MLCTHFMLQLDTWGHGARTDFINSNYLSIILYGFILMSCRPRPVYGARHILTPEPGIIWFSMLTFILYMYMLYLIVYVDRNKTLYLSYDDLWFVFKNDYRTRIIYYAYIIYRSSARDV